MCPFGGAITHSTLAGVAAVAAVTLITRRLTQPVIPARRPLAAWRQEDNAARWLHLPEYLVRMILDRFPEMGSPAVDVTKGETAGWEAYIRVYRRLYDLLASGRSPIYTTSDPAKDQRLRELEDIMRWTEMWHEFLQKSVATEGLSKQQKGSWGFSHQVRARQPSARARPQRVCTRARGAAAAVARLLCP